jgi:hypothetical protein
LYHLSARWSVFLLTRFLLGTDSSGSKHEFLGSIPNTERKLELHLDKVQLNGLSNFILASFCLVGFLEIFPFALLSCGLHYHTTTIIIAIITIIITITITIPTTFTSLPHHHHHLFSLMHPVYPPWALGFISP